MVERAALDRVIGVRVPVSQLDSQVESFVILTIVEFIKLT